MTANEEHLEHEYRYFIERVEELRKELENYKGIYISIKTILNKLDKVLDY